MSKLTNQELNYVIGGFTFNGTFISAITRAFKAFYQMGQSFGTAIHMIVKNKTC